MRWIWIFLLIGCSHNLPSNMIYHAYFPMTARIGNQIEWEVITSTRADSMSWKIYLTHGPGNKNAAEYYMGELHPVRLWTMDMLSVKGIKSDQDPEGRYSIPPLEISGHYKVYVNVWNNWFEDKRTFYMSVNQDAMYESFDEYRLPRRY